MSLDQRRTDLVLAVIENLLADGRTTFRPGDVVARLRERNEPMGTWEVRGELSRLEAEGVLALDPDTAEWRKAKARSRKAG
ncbi:MAG: hypothetical protein RIC56_24235 [Pseudomonadales bacterium]